MTIHASTGANMGATTGGAGRARSIRPRRAALALAAIAVVALAGCGGSTPAAPSASAAPASVAPASVAPASAAPTAAPTEAPTAAPTEAPSAAQGGNPAEAAAALAAFKTLIADETLAYRMEQTGAFTSSAGNSDFSYAIDVAGSDFAATMTVLGQTTDLRGVDGTLYVKGADGTWQSGALDKAALADILNPWQYLGPLDGLTYTAPAADPAGALQFTNSGPVDYATSTMRQNGITGSIGKLTFTVLPDGTPVSLAFGAEAPDGQGGTVTVTSTVVFSKVGEAATIEKPTP